MPTSQQGPRSDGERPSTPPPSGSLTRAEECSSFCSPRVGAQPLIARHEPERQLLHHAAANTKQLGFQRSGKRGGQWLQAGERMGAGLRSPSGGALTCAGFPMQQ